ncbi:MAG: tyrosine-type recombinase/integrase, partial [Dehalococcoidia bacterium]|nr:tyrosine-type recombinase/integrase [Dehalococcoidia bacterium]
LKSQRLHVRHTLQRYGREYSLAEPKTTRSRRIIALAPSTVKSLTHHRARQAEERLIAGPNWSDEDFVFSTEFGKPLDVGELGRKYLRTLLADSDISIALRFHDLRHTAISFALSRGVAPTDVAEMAGHSSVALTLTRYAHALPDASRRASDAIEDAIAG